MVGRSAEPHGDSELKVTEYFWKIDSRKSWQRQCPKCRHEPAQDRRVVFRCPGSRSLAHLKHSVFENALHRACCHAGAIHLRLCLRGRLEKSLLKWRARGHSQGNNSPAPFSWATPSPPFPPGPVRPFRPSRATRPESPARQRQHGASPQAQPFRTSRSKANEKVVRAEARTTIWGGERLRCCFPGLVGQPRLRRGVEERVAGVSRSALMCTLESAD